MLWVGYKNMAHKKKVVGCCSILLLCLIVRELYWSRSWTPDTAKDLVICSSLYKPVWFVGQLQHHFSWLCIILMNLYFFVSVPMGNNKVDAEIDCTQGSKCPIVFVHTALIDVVDNPALMMTWSRLTAACTGNNVNNGSAQEMGNSSVWCK